MATFDPSTHQWLLDPDEADFSMPAGTTIDGIADNSLSNRLTADDGNNTIFSTLGNDTLIGGKGDDVYDVWDPRWCTFGEALDEGYDTIYFANNPQSALQDFVFEIPDNVEALFIAQLCVSGIVRGNGADNTIRFMDISSSSKSRSFLVDGGAGADHVIIGDAGDYTVRVDNIGDTVEISSGPAIVKVESSVSFTLGDFIRRLTLTGFDEIDGTGNDGSNEINGNDAPNLLKGLGGDDVLDGRAGVDTLEGGTGNDIYILETPGEDTVIESASAGIDTIVSWFGLSLLDFPNVENLTVFGPASARLTGTSSANTLIGGAGDDTIDGAGGADRMEGGAGDDTYYVDDDGDVVVEAANAGIDTVLSRRSFSLAALVNVEHLTVTGTASATLTGNSRSNFLVGNIGNDTLDGGAGADRLVGGAGDDVYILGVLGEDAVVEAFDAGIDTIISTVGLSLAEFANVENLTVTGSTSARLTGTSSANTLIGGAGDDTINGAGGADRMEGGAGNDTYYIDSADDAVIEAANGGIDTIIAVSSFSLASLANVENLSLTGFGPARLTGNALSNVIIGNAGNDTIDGGAGADRMEGGAGDDTYYVDNADDVVLEAAGGGHDTAIVSLDFHMDRLANVEVLKLADGSTAVRATGGAGADHLIGNGAFNILDGGAGADTLEGGAGSDVYLVDNAGDVVIEAAGGGADAVQTSVSFALSDSSEIEFLTALGSSALALTGNALANTLSGNGGANVLHGMGGNDRAFGGAGADRLYGDAGNDTLGGGAGHDRLTGGTGRFSRDMFVFDTKLTSKRVAKANLDKITDFGPKYDAIGFDDAAFTNRTIATYVKRKGEATLDHALKISKSWFRVGDKALDRNDFFIYNDKTHTLYFDADGSGHKAMVAVTTFGHFERHAGATLTYKDLFLV